MRSSLPNSSTLMSSFCRAGSNGMAPDSWLQEMSTLIREAIVPRDLGIAPSN